MALQPLGRSRLMLPCPKPSAIRARVETHPDHATPGALARFAPGRTSVWRNPLRPCPCGPGSGRCQHLRVSPRRIPLLGREGTDPGLAALAISPGLGQRPCGAAHMTAAASGVGSEEFKNVIGATVGTRLFGSLDSARCIRWTAIRRHLPGRCGAPAATTAPDAHLRSAAAGPVTMRRTLVIARVRNRGTRRPPDRRPAHRFRPGAGDTGSGLLQPSTLGRPGGAGPRSTKSRCRRSQ